MFVSVVDNNASSVQELANYYLEKLLKLINNDITICYNNRAVTLGITDCSRMLSEIMSFDDYPKVPVAYSFHSMVSSSYMSAETKSTGAGVVCLYVLLSLVCDKNYSTSEYYDVLQENNYIPSHKEWKVFIKSLFRNDQASLSILLTALTMSDPASQVSIRIDNSKQTQVEIVDNHILPIGMHTGLVSCSGGNIKMSNPKVCIIDGIIESVSEVHHIFSHFNETGEGIVIIARGFADDVISTISKNRLRKTLDCLPIVIGVDVESMNYLADLSVICGTDVLSSTKGELISSIDPKELSTISTLEQNTTTTRITVDESPSLIHHRNRVEEKRKRSHEALQENFSSRLRLLSGKCTNIILGKDCGDACGIMKDRIGFGIKAHSSILRLGISNLGGSHHFFDLVNSGIGFLPSGALYYGTKCALKSHKLLNDTSKFIIKDRYES